MKLILFSLLLIYSSLTYAQVTVVKIDTTKLPKQIKHSGHITNAVTWKDNLGTNYVLTTETGQYKTTDNEGGEYKNAALYVYHYITKGDSTTMLLLSARGLLSEPCAGQRPRDLSKRYL